MYKEYCIIVGEAVSFKKFMYFDSRGKTRFYTIDCDLPPCMSLNTIKNMQDPLLTKTRSDTYLGFDFGNKKIGVAVGQTITATASPLQTIRSINQNPNWEIIGKLIHEWRPTGLVVGVSRQVDGSDNPITPRMLKFCRQLEGRYQLPVFQQDEALSTFEAKQLLFDEVSVNASKLWEVQDQLAAQLILQTWLNEQAKK